MHRHILLVTKLVGARLGWRFLTPLDTEITLLPNKGTRGYDY